MDGWSACALGFGQAVMLDTDGFAAEVSGEHVSPLWKGVIETTSLMSIPCGITRDLVITLARDRQIPVVEERFSRDEPYTADEVFFTGTAAKITPVREVDNRRIGPGRPGPITTVLQKEFIAVVRGERALQRLADSGLTMV